MTARPKARRSAAMDTISADILCCVLCRDNAEGICASAAAGVACGSQFRVFGDCDRQTTPRVAGPHGVPSGVHGPAGSTKVDVCRYSLTSRHNTTAYNGPATVSLIWLRRKCKCLTSDNKKHNCQQTWNHPERCQQMGPKRR